MLKLIRKVCCSWWMTSVMSTGIEIVSRIPYPHHLSLTYIQWSQDLGSTSLKEESESESYPVTSDSLRPHGLYSPWNSPGQNTRVGNLSLLQGIFPTQGSNPGLLHCRQILYQLSHNGSPRILEWVAYPFSSGSSWLRNQRGWSSALQANSLSTELSGKPYV